MKLTESEGKEIFRKYSIPVPNSILITNPVDVESAIKKLTTDEVVVKAQVLVGSRKKKGLIRIAKKKDAKKACQEILDKKEFKIQQILIEEKIPFQMEQYLSLTIDGFSRSIMVLYSEQGGIEIEGMTERVRKLDITKVTEKDFSQNGSKLVALIEKLKRIMLENDAQLVEINPLVVVNNELLALDSKIIIDDNALFRHKEFEKLSLREFNDIEKKAEENGLHYVDLSGNIGIIGCGAGLVMATLDLLKQAGLEASNFLDLGGGASKEKMRLALDLLTRKEGMMAIFVNIFGGITRCDEIANGIAEFKPKMPLVVRMIGTNEEEGKKILQANGIIAVNSIDEGINTLKKLIK